jgi:MraZ protein
VELQNFAMFIGEFRHTIDPKKRLAIPSKFRAHLGERAVLTRGIDNCLILYPLEEWKKIAQKLSSLPSSKGDARGFSRIMLAGATDVELDALGRILIPDYLKAYGTLQKNVVVIGLYNRIEIWAAMVWDEYQKSIEKEVGNMAERLQELGI